MRYSDLIQEIINLYMEKDIFIKLYMLIKDKSTKNRIKTRISKINIEIMKLIEAETNYISSCEHISLR